MSKLLELMEVRRTGELYASLKPLSALCNIDEGYMNTVYGQEYRIQVKLGAKVVVSEESGESLEYAVKQVKRSVNEAVFGEFRVPLREIQRLLWERKYDEVSARLSRLEMEMFSV